MDHGKIFGFGSVCCTQFEHIRSKMPQSLCFFLPHVLLCQCVYTLAREWVNWEATHTCMHTHTHTHARTHVYTCTNTHAHMHTHAHTCTQTHIHTHTYTHAHMHLWDSKVKATNTTHCPGSISNKKWLYESLPYVVNANCNIHFSDSWIWEPRTV